MLRLGGFSVISPAAARQAEQSLALDMSRGVGKIYQMGAPTLDVAIDNPIHAAYYRLLLFTGFRTVATEAGVLEEIVGRLLNHTPLSITGQRHARPSLDALRPAMQAACDALKPRLQGS